jgi:hypothetical protein
VTITERLDGDTEWVICRCGNEAHLDGFYTCAEDGRIVPPVLDGEWNEVLYLCMRCGRYFDQNTLEVVGVISEQVAYINANYDWDSH